MKRASLLLMLICILGRAVQGQNGALQTEVDLRPEPGGVETAFTVPELTSSAINYSVSSVGPSREIEELRHESLVYRFDVRGSKNAQVQMRLANRFLVMVSTDLKNWHEVLKYPADVANTHLANLNWYTIDLTPQLPARQIYVRVQHGDKENAGFGPLVFGVKLLTDSPKLDRAFISAPLAAHAPKLDGRLDDPCWALAPRSQTFSLFHGQRLPGETTTLQTVWDKAGLYFSIRANDAEAAKLPRRAMVNKAQRDKLAYLDDCLELFIDPKLNRKNYLHLLTNSLGAQYDERDRPNSPESFNGRWQVATAIDATGWNAEFFIPWSDLQVSPVAGMLLGFNATRTKSAELLTLNTVAETWHEPQHFGYLQLTTAPSLALDVIATSVKAGRNEAILRVRNSGQQEVKADALFQVKSAGEVSFQSLHPLQLAGGAALDIPVSFEVAKPGIIDLTAHVLTNGLVGAGAVLSAEASADNFVLFEAVSRQPFYRNEPKAVFQTRLDVSAERAKTMRIKLSLQDESGRQLQETELAPKTGSADILLDLKNVQIGKYSAKVDLFENDKVIQTKSYPLEKLAPLVEPPLSCKTDDWGNFYVNDKKTFLRVFALAGSGQAVQIRQFGGNAAITHGPHTITDFSSNPKQWLQDMAADAQGFAQQASQVYMFPHLCGLFRGGADFDGLRAIVSYLKDQPRLAGWYLADEPSGWATRLEDLKKAKQIINEIDPHHPVLIIDSAPAAYHVWAQAADIFSGDPYPFLGESLHPLSMVGDWTKAAVQASDPPKPVWMCLQTAGKPWFNHYPTPLELRNMFYQALVNGSRGMIYWQMQATTESGDAGTFQALARESDALAPFLMDTTPSEPKTIAAGATQIQVLSKRLGNQQVIIAVNTTDKAGTAEIDIPAGLKATRWFEAGEVQMSQGRIVQAFQPYGVSVYRIGR